VAKGSKAGGFSGESGPNLLRATGRVQEWIGLVLGVDDFDPLN